MAEWPNGVELTRDVVVRGLELGLFPGDWIIHVPELHAREAEYRAMEKEAIAPYNAATAYFWDKYEHETHGAHQALEDAKNKAWLDYDECCHAAWLRAGEPKWRYGCDHMGIDIRRTCDKALQATCRREQAVFNDAIAGPLRECQKMIAPLYHAYVQRLIDAVLEVVKLIEEEG